MKEFSREDVLAIINRYYEQYNLPEMGINNGDIDSLLTNLRGCLDEYNSNDIETAVNIIIRKAINLALLDDCDTINLYYVIRAMDDLRAFSIPEESINETRYKIMLDALKNNTKNEKTITK